MARLRNSVALPAMVVAITLGALAIPQWTTYAQDASPATVDQASAVRSSTRPTTRPVVRRERIEEPVVPPEELARIAADLRRQYAKPPAEWPAAEVDPSVKHVELGLLPEVEHPADNPYSRAKADLGRELFFERRLSGSGQWACASCHNPELGWGDGITTSFGHDRQLHKRNAPTLMNVGLQKSLFWDGRAVSLEEQVIGPITTENEMNADVEKVVAALKEKPIYVKRFVAAFGDEQITIDRIAQALACFERTVVGGRSRFDQFLRGKHDALSDEAIRGLHLFRTKAGCINCHNGPNFTDGQFHNVGLSYYGRKLQDLGRYEITKDPKDVGAFKTPTLRNIERTAPYMHNGLFELDGVLNLYNAGMPTLRPRPGQENDPLFPTKSHLLKPLNLTRAEIADLKAFLLSLTEPKQRVRVVEDEN